MSLSETESPLPTSRLLLILGVGVSLMHIWFNVVTVLPTLWQNEQFETREARIATPASESARSRATSTPTSLPRPESARASALCSAV